MNIIEQLVNIYFNEECVLFKDWMKVRMNQEQAYDYHKAPTLFTRSDKLH